MLMFVSFWRAKRSPSDRYVDVCEFWRAKRSEGVNCGVDKKMHECCTNVEYRSAVKRMNV